MFSDVTVMMLSYKAGLSIIFDIEEKSNINNKLTGKLKYFEFFKCLIFHEKIFHTQIEIQVRCLNFLQFCYFSGIFLMKNIFYSVVEAELFFEGTMKKSLFFLIQTCESSYVT